jgi:hypothetical protein
MLNPETGMPEHRHAYQPAHDFNAAHCLPGDTTATTFSFTILPMADTLTFVHFRRLYGSDVLPFRKLNPA